MLGILRGLRLPITLATRVFSATPFALSGALRSTPFPLFGARAYHDNVVDHYESPRNVGSLDTESASVGSGLVGAPACGDVMRLQIQVDDDGNVVDAKFKTFGCGSAIASSSYATEWIKGKNVDDCLKISNKDIASHLRLPPVKLHCSMLAEDAVKAAVNDYREKKDKLNAPKEE